MCVTICSENTPQRYLSVAKECMHQIQSCMDSPSVTTPFQFNHGQCEYLIQKLKSAVEIAEECILSHSGEHRGNCLKIFKLLSWLAKEIESFVEDCRKKNWIEAAMLFTNMSEHVSSLGFDLELSTKLLSSRKLFRHILDELEEMRPAVVSLVKERALGDQRTLLKRLETHMSHSSNSNNLDQQLASCLHGRLTQILSGTVQFSIWEVDHAKSVERLGSTQLGRGAFGEVRKTRWFRFEVAEKIFYGSNHPSFKNEVEILAGLAHPNIVPLLGYAIDNNRYSIIMELMDGDLFHLMQDRMHHKKSHDGPFTIFEAVDIMLQIGEGMVYLHNNKIVHRDVKSQNILFKKKKYIDGSEHICAKLADFGLSKTKENSSTFSNQTPNTGTTRWMAPELMSRGQVGSKVKSFPFQLDVYSFGMLCYEILTGAVPFSNTCSHIEVKRKVLDGVRPSLPEQCPDELKVLIQGCWHAEASLRPLFSDICKSLRRLRCSLMTCSLMVGVESVYHDGDIHCLAPPSLEVPKKKQGPVTRRLRAAPLTRPRKRASSPSDNMDEGSRHESGFTSTENSSSIMMGDYFLSSNSSSGTVGEAEKAEALKLASMLGKKKICLR